MVQVLRSCSKTACRWPAAASLSYRYATRQVWLLDLAPTTDPSLYDLCPHHADAMVVPKGWERVDDRTVQEVMVEPSAFERGEEAARRRRTATAADMAPPVQANRALVGATAGRNRYAALVEQLPRLAAEAGVPGAATAAPASIRSAPDPAQKQPATAQPLADVPVQPLADVQAPAEAQGPPATPSEPPLPPTAEPRTAPAAEPRMAPAAPQPPSPPAQRPVMQHARSAPPMPSRELAPSPPGEAAFSEPEVEPPLPGQLAMPVGDADEPSGVVLPFELAGSRRRTPRS